MEGGALNPVSFGETVRGGGGRGGGEEGGPGQPPRRLALPAAPVPGLLAREVRQLLHNKFVVVLGDSVQRAVYKDLVLLLQKDRLLSTRQLKTKGERSFEHDTLLEGGCWGPMHNGTHYREVREFCTEHHLVRFYFVTRAYSPYVEHVLGQLRWGEHAPDLVIMNSCLWDLSRYRPNFRSSYPRDVQTLFQRLDEALPESCLIVWNTTMPVARVVTGGFLPRGGRASRAVRLREDVMEANFYSAVEAVRRGFDVLDLHFHFRHAEQHRVHDGVHWDRLVHRYLSQLLLAHVAHAWGVMLPHRLPPAGPGPGAGRWLTDVPPALTAEPRSSADESQARDGHRDPGEPTPSRYRRQRSPRSSWPSSDRARTPRLPPSRRESRSLTYAPPARQWPRYSDAPRLPIEYPREADARNQEQGLGPIRRSWAHRRRGSPPYPPQRPSEPPRWQGRPTPRNRPRPRRTR